MPRRGRLHIPGAYYHVLSRGLERKYKSTLALFIPRNLELQNGSWYEELKRRFLTVL